MPQCAVATCRNSHRRTRGRRIRYHRFPQIPEVRSRWVRACGREPLPNGGVPFNIQTARICSLHFTNESYEKDMEHLVLGLPVRSRLRRGAVPTIGVPVEVEPVTKMLVENAKRSLLKVTNSGKAANQKLKGTNNNADNPKPKRNQNNAQKEAKVVKNTVQQAPPPPKPVPLPPENGALVIHPSMIGLEVLFAVGLKPAKTDDKEKDLNKMHAMEGGSSGSGKKADSDKHEEDSSKSPKVPQNQQNGAALPEETAVDGLRSTSVKKESYPAVENDAKHPILQSELLQLKTSRAPKEEKVTTGRKRRSMEDVSANGGPIAKKMCFDQQREQYINALIGNEKSSAEELTVRSEQLRADVQALDALARAKEHEWNEILCMRKLKEEAYLRLERRRQVVGFMESNGPTSEALQPVTLTMSGNWERTGSSMNAFGKDKCTILPISKEERKSTSRDSSPAYRKDKVNAKAQARRQASATPPLKQAAAENGRKQADSQSPENRQIGEGRQGPILDVRSIIADYRLRHPETAPKRRGRRMRNSVNVGLGAGGAMVEAGQVIDSRPSSTDSCKSNPNSTDPNSMSFKDVLVQFARLSQQQGEPIKTPQNYPDVTLHPVAPSSVPQNVPQQSGSLLHGILTKSQSPRPTTFSPTLARLLTAPERERAATVVPAQQSTAAAQHLLQTYQGSNPVSISDLLSSSKARTEITITPVVNNNMMHADDIEEESAILEERDSRVSGPRDGREDRDTPPRCQGCHDRAAQFVCAGCGNQWYCSRECQVAAWDDHSEVCSG